MSVQRAKLLLTNLRERVQQDMSIAHAGLDQRIFSIQVELNARPTQDQRSLYDQLLSVYQLANNNGHYDAADWIMREGIEPVQKKMMRPEKTRG